ncbi:trypsin beta-like [Drosophila eugracilis]|uniref:trypsin beta-like n=1 Tax=Drosophila eugracilis TaxID=29029 RepID=UPI001BDA526C|nr:trypsin beta-like [Drosophila eugracilis]
MFVQWILLIFSVTLTSCHSLPERIVGGNSISIRSVPWQASLQKYGKHWCGAVIYSSDIIITAAHCVKGASAGAFSVRVGSSYTRYGGQVVKVSKILGHESYDKSLANDIAVIRLQSKLSLGTAVRSIPLAESSPATGSSASVSGWGSIAFQRPISKALHGVSVDIVDRNKCQRSYSGFITKEMICAAAPGKDSCSGDSGGPLVSNGELVGIVSFGMNCAHPKYPGVYANVAELKPWILKAIQRI